MDSNYINVNARGTIITMLESDVRKIGLFNDLIDSYSDGLYTNFNPERVHKLFDLLTDTLLGYSDELYDLIREYRVDITGIVSVNLFKGALMKELEEGETVEYLACELMIPGDILGCQIHQSYWSIEEGVNMNNVVIKIGDTEICSELNLDSWEGDESIKRCTLGGEDTKRFMDALGTEDDEKRDEILLYDAKYRDILLVC